MSEMSFRERMTSTEMRHADQLAFSMRMISEIPASYNATVDSGQALHAVAMIDAFYVHLRLLGDFLVKRTKETDIGPRDFGVRWSIPETDSALRLAEYWNIASKYVVHFGQVRVPDQIDDLRVFEVNARSMTAMAVDTLTVLAPFVNALGARSPQSGQDTRVLVEQATYLRHSFNQACDRLGLNPESVGLNCM